MRLNINLASRPFEDVRQFLAVWGSALALLAIITGGLLYYSIFNWHASRDVSQKIEQTRKDNERLDKEKAKAIDTLNRPENKTVADQSRFLNQTIARKSLSWTRVFMDLEKMMPPRLHVVSMTPELAPDNQLQLRLTVAGDSRDKAVELVRRMETSPMFRSAQLRSETMAQNGGSSGTDHVMFHM